ncbi:DUF1800 family protein [Akkermansiaceae bacterium]|nr:DUF1800 family protein [Akkermansiaceae bacterium]MDB4813655.1 DUF1800 family protein [bacterium]MDA8975706.1 DUF1800 family protein [Akkermansiaceae bacterium]MDB4305357.1 DUF1800 family protein [Akkermansiaceae bacterium]MDB4321262.1 DUF1800 family protein [Akkermansiaceae bacterium]
MGNFQKMFRNLSLLTERTRFLWVVAVACSSQQASGIIDLNGDSVSDIWEKMYPGISHGEQDTDGDGFSNYEEMVAGTDPTDRTSFFVINRIVDAGPNVILQWNAILGKRYIVEIWRESEGWQVHTRRPISEVSALRGIVFPREESKAIFRVSVSDEDSDEDGLSAWEEALLGFDDSTPYGSGSETAQDYEQFLRALESTEGVLLTNGIALAQRLPTGSEASRFLLQASFGPTMDSIGEVEEVGITTWIDNQMTMSRSLTGWRMYQSGQVYNRDLWKQGWWHSAIIASDQLRHRMSYALSQILVVGYQGGSLVGDNILIQADYYDAFVNGSFGKYRSLLDNVTYSPAMGYYLSHFRNRKSDPPSNRFPDENFAREIMQLFSIGLWELNQDGTRKTDPEGNFIPTYDISTVSELAKVFTGMGPVLSQGREATSFYDPVRISDLLAPMKVWDEEHEPGEKVLFGGDYIIPSGQTGEEDVQQALDILGSHPSTAPFISSLLIQRFTTSNPTPSYVKRVSRAWTHSGGDLGQVLRAILLDPEVRYKQESVEGFGKVREPIIRAIHLLRAFSPADHPNTFAAQISQLKNDFGQFAMLSPTVFNFYSPSFSPQGELRDAGLVSPEMEIATMTTLLGTHNQFRQIAASGHFTRQVDYGEEELLAYDMEALVDRLDILLTAGSLSASTRASVIEGAEPFTHPATRVRVAAHLITTSPDFTVLK